MFFHSNPSPSYYYLLLIYLFIYIFFHFIEKSYEENIKFKKTATSKHVFCFTCFKKLFLLTQSNFFFLKNKNDFSEFSSQTQFYLWKHQKSFLKLFSKTIFKNNNQTFLNFPYQNFSQIYFPYPYTFPI